MGSFDIRKNTVSGTVPAELGLLTALTSLKLGSNLLTGTICTEIGKLSNLVELLLENNELTGSLPDTLTDLGDLGTCFLILVMSQRSRVLSYTTFLFSAVEFQVVNNPLEGAVPEELCAIVEGLSVDHVGCNLVCTCCVDETVCGTS